MRRWYIMPLRDDNALRQCVWSDRLNVRPVNTGRGAHARVSALATLTAQSPQGKCNLRTKKKRRGLCVYRSNDGVETSATSRTGKPGAVNDCFFNTRFLQRSDITKSAVTSVLPTLHSLDTNVGISVHFGQCQDAPYCKF